MRSNILGKSLSKYWIVFLLLLTTFFIVSQYAEAKVLGQCANCHTMHNSQDGLGMVSVRGDEASGALGDCAGCHVEPRENLLTLSCVACHAMDLTPGPSLPVFDGVYPIPQVVYQTTDSLAAGNFYYVFSGDQYGHNVHGFGGTASGGAIDPDTTINPLGTPPGYVKAMDPSTGYFTGLGFPEVVFDPGGSQPDQPMCSGTYGCHGNRDVRSQSMSMAGAHHANDSMLKFGSINTAQQGFTTGTSYRFLSGVIGGEHATWESTVSSGSHNEYFGAVLANRTSQSSSDIDTVSELCASCHGNFHMKGGAVGTGLSNNALGSPSPWIRHPSDVLIPNAAPYNVYKTYNDTAPVARTVIPNSPVATTGIDGTGGSGSPIVFCLTCHRAHASNELDSLRFSYALMVTGSAGGVAGDGCFACHSDK
jgi:hypothetical protein